MKDIDEIIKCRRLLVVEKTSDGFKGIIQMPLWEGSIIMSWGMGWEHISVCPKKKSVTPSWDDMCLIKDIFFEETEAVIQIHPPKAEYVNNMPNCLHLWRWADGEMTLPPSWMVGIKVGQTQEELMAEIKQYYRDHGKEF